MKRAFAMLAAGCVAGSVAGCAGSDNFLASTGSSATSAIGNMLTLNKSSAGPAPSLKTADNDTTIECPQVEVLDGTASVRTYGGTDQTNDNVKYQYSMGDIARECSRAGNQIMIKVGVEGRVLLGPVGQPGSFNVPIRIAVRRDSDQQPAAGKLYQVPTTVPFGQTQGEFTLVSEPLAVPFIQAHADEDYTILVGFDDHTATAGAKAPVKKKRKGAPG